MFRRILLANRGEVAVRVLRTCKRLGIEAVAVTTDVDRDLSWLEEADEVVELGDRRAYLDQDKLLAAAQATRCSALHPGWGFLSENPTFAARCEAAAISFVGPRSPSMRRMADKAQARDTMAALGLLPIPGGEGVLASVEEARVMAQELGYPVLLKAVAGGGGRGMRRVFEPGGLEGAWQSAQAEAQSAFGDGRLYLEKLVLNGRHIELQVLGDGRGGVAILGERECSVQRRHQKLIEETPSVVLDEAQRQRITALAQGAVASLAYRGAGTLEMLRDQDGHLWFMEMNTRLQVEHTITEQVWEHADGRPLDLVEQQLRVAANGELPQDLRPTGGHAIECRINAEDPTLDFRPAPGVLETLVLPSGPGLRVDTHLRQGDRISPHYDSMFAKLVATGADREQAIERMLQALETLEVEGVKTTVALHLAVLRHPDFRAGSYHTGWLEESGIIEQLRADERAAAAEQAP